MECFSCLYHEEEAYLHVLILPSLRLRRFVDVPGGNFNHFQEPTRSYARGSPGSEDGPAASSMVTRT